MILIADCSPLWGRGGIGKTRLALRVAEELGNEFLHGVCFVPLAPVISPDLVVPTLAQRLGFQLEGTRDPQTQLLHYLPEKEMLIVLDSLEHLLSSAGAILEILKNTRDVKIIVTARERLNLQAEWTYPVHGLDLPDTADGEIESYSAVRLFLQSARRARPDFAPTPPDRAAIAHICRFLDGLPLGIELAAAWVQDYTCPVIAEQIEQDVHFLATTMQDVPPRHKSLHAVFEYSWNLLSPPERNVLCRLSVFRGGFRETAATPIAAASLKSLLSLHGKSLVWRSNTGRYGMLKIVRQFAEEKLHQLPELELPTRDLHAGFFAGVLNQQIDALKRGNLPALDQVLEDIENIRAGWRWAVEHGNTEWVDRAMDGLTAIYEMQGWFQEGVEVFAAAVKKFSNRNEPDAPRVAGRLLAREGLFAFRLAKYERAQQALESALNSAREKELPAEVAFVVNNLGNVADRLGKHSQAVDYWRESLALSRKIGDLWGTARALTNLGFMRQQQGKRAEAQSLLEEGLGIRRSIGDRMGVAKTLINLGSMATDAHDFQAAQQLHEESLAIFKGLNARLGVAICLNNLGYNAYCKGRYAEARELYQQSLSIRRELGDQWGMATALDNLGTLACADGNYAAARENFNQAWKIASEIRATRKLVEISVDVAQLLVKESQGARAVELLTLALNHPAINAESKETAQRLWSTLALELPPEKIAAAAERGKNLSLDQVVEIIAQEK